MEKFNTKTQIIYGENSLLYLKELVGKKIFIVADPFMKTAGLLNKITMYFDEKDYIVFDDIEQDPSIETVVKGAGKIIEYSPEAVIVLGGGSAIDAAKAIIYFSQKLANMHKCIFAAIPTTSGTGSEVTSFSVITDKAKGIKYPLVSEQLLPDAAILSAELVKTVPPKVVADTGIDVLTHAIEAYVSTKATVFSDALAQKAVELVFKYLVRSYKNPDDAEAKENMHYASCIAGLAFNMASLGLNHAMAHNIGARLHMSHGRVNALLLPYVIEFNSQDKNTAEKYASLAQYCGVRSENTNMAVRGLVTEIRKLERTLQLPLKFEQASLTLQEKSEIAEMTLKDRCIKTNPHTVTKDEITAILNKLI